MSPAAAFGLALALTLSCLGTAVWSGLRARRRVHITAVACALASLALTIYLAYRLGHTLDLASAGVITPIHMTLARVAVVALLLPIAFGVRTLFVPRGRKLHGRLAFLALALIVAAAVTGVAMVALARRADQP